MIILDTNVLSEPIKPQPNPLVLDWLDRQDIDTLYLTTLNVAEVLYGIELLSEGKRKKTLKLSMTKLLDRRIGGRILPFDDLAARRYVSIAVLARKHGQSLSFADAQIGAIAAIHGFAVATRDEVPFKAMGIKVINPWNTLFN